MAKAEREGLIHGGDWAGFEEEYGREPLDFSMNVNPLGIAGEVKEAIGEAAERADRYPDPLCRELRAAIADAEDVPAEWVFCGNGAADIIDRIAMGLDPGQAGMRDNPNLKMNRGGAQDNPEGRTALVTSPTFAEYEEALARCGWRVEHHELKERHGFAVTESILESISTDTGILFLCEPNNPTGVTTDGKLLDRIARRCRETDTLLVVDECFNGFLDEPKAHTMKGKLEEYPGMIILKAFTKLYGMAGVRLGYCLCADEKLLEKLRGAGQPWSVSHLAQRAGIAALNTCGHVERARRIVREERAWLKEQLGALGVSPVFGEANYLLFYAGAREHGGEGDGWRAEGNAPDLSGAGSGSGSLGRMLREKGILVRSCGNYASLGEGWYRIAVRTRDENQKLIDALREMIWK